MRIGAQRPRVRSVPPYSRSLGGEFVDFMAEIGRPLDPWQAHGMHDMLGIDHDGLWTAPQVAYLVARQNGKGGITEARELGGLFLLREKEIVHSAHQFKTSGAAFARLLEIIDGSDWLTRRVARVLRSKGEEGIKLTGAAGGGYLRFVSRWGGSGRGLTGDTSIFDEAVYLTIAQYADISPVLSARPNPQLVFTTTPPDDDVGPMPQDSILPSIRRRGHAGAELLALLEWSPPPGYDRSDRSVWHDCNPALGIRISERFLALQLDTFTEAGRPEKFSTEHLGEWPDDPSAQWLVFGQEDWAAACDPASRFDGVKAFGLDVSWDRSHATVGVAGRRADGRRMIEVAKRAPGTAWAVPWLVERVAKWEPCALVVQAGSPAASLVPDLEAAGLEVVMAGVQELGRATGSIFDGVSGRDVAGRDISHLGQEELTTAAAAAVWRSVGDAKVWDRQAAAKDISPLVAVTLAAWGHATKAHLAADPLQNFW